MVEIEWSENLREAKFEKNKVTKTNCLKSYEGKYGNFCY